jgi:hypothetical protein
VLSLDDAIEGLGRAGYTEVERVSELEARVSSPAGGLPVRLRLTRDGRIFGGNYGLELSTEESVLPPTRGLSARGKNADSRCAATPEARRGAHECCRRTSYSRFDGNSQMKE